MAGPHHEVSLICFIASPVVTYAYCCSSFWRPLLPVHDAPLVLCDRRSVDAKDYIAVDDVMPDRVEEELFLKDGISVPWYWLDDQLPDESFLFVQWDSEREGLGSRQSSQLPFWMWDIYIFYICPELCCVHYHFRSGKRARPL